MTKTKAATPVNPANSATDPAGNPIDPNQQYDQNRLVQTPVFSDVKYPLPTSQAVELNQTQPIKQEMMQSTSQPLQPVGEDPNFLPPLPDVQQLNVQAIPETPAVQEMNASMEVSPTVGGDALPELPSLDNQLNNFSNTSNTPASQEAPAADNQYFDIEQKPTMDLQSSSPAAVPEVTVIDQPQSEVKLQEPKSEATKTESTSSSDNNKTFIEFNSQSEAPISNGTLPELSAPVITEMTQAAETPVAEITSESLPEVRTTAEVTEPEVSIVESAQESVVPSIPEIPAMPAAIEPQIEPVVESSAQTITETPSQDIVEELSQMQDEINEVTQTVQPETVSEVDSSVPMVESTQQTVEPPVLTMPVKQTQPTEQSQSANTIESYNSQGLKVFKNIAFIGLNTETVNSKLNEKLISVLKGSIDMGATNIVIDSNRSYGKSIVETLRRAEGVSITGMYLKPFYSDFSDESESRVALENYSSLYFSNLADKFRHLVKSADIFIFPEITGVNNLSLLFTLWQISHLYLGQNKPIILLGNAWNDVIQNLKTMFKVSQEELSAVRVCSTAEEVLGLISKLDADYSSKSSVKVNSVLDMRDEQEEGNLFVSKIA